MGTYVPVPSTFRRWIWLCCVATSARDGLTHRHANRLHTSGFGSTTSGGGGIRTLGTGVTRTTVFETAPSSGGFGSASRLVTPPDSPWGPTWGPRRLMRWLGSRTRTLFQVPRTSTTAAIGKELIDQAPTAPSARASCTATARASSRFRRRTKYGELLVAPRPTSSSRSSSTCARRGRARRARPPNARRGCHGGRPPLMAG
jgi:hypothetical protein